MIKQAYQGISEYLNGTRKTFNFPIKIKGTSFEQRVWKELQKIPYGTKKSYQEIALAIGKEKNYCAVGNANHKNPLLLVIPCHRVIGKDRHLKEFGAGIDIKKQ